MAKSLFFITCVTLLHHTSFFFVFKKSFPNLQHSNKSQHHGAFFYYSLPHNGETVSNNIFVFCVIPYKIKNNLSPYPWKKRSEAFKYVNFQLQKFSISIVLPNISIFFEALTFYFLRKGLKSRLVALNPKILYFDNDGDLRG